MTDLKPGDKVRWEPVASEVRVIVAIDGKTAWTRLVDYPEATGRLLPLNELKKHVPFFEAGRTYTVRGMTFEASQVGEDGSGPVAFGVQKRAGDDRSRWCIKRRIDYGYWVTPQVTE